ncbi:MAG: ATP synthase F0 subunit B [Clostridiales bacterium]|jgi:F-type H+-transporting ATPase subunit b|nr:ATP synthase F0 subunit B [Clostridiales bacterium]
MDVLGAQIFGAGGIEVLGIDGLDILLHLANLIVLILVVYLLVYKRVKTAMKKRADAYIAAEEDIAARKKEAEELKAEYSALLDKANNDAARINEAAAVAAEIQAKAIVGAAKKDALIIVEKASKDTALEKAKMKAELKNEIAEIAVDIAGKILMREIKNEDTERVIGNALNEWSK